jgi:hypothetical protein
MGCRLEAAMAQRIGPAAFDHDLDIVILGIQFDDPKMLVTAGTNDVTYRGPPLIGWRGLVLTWHCGEGGIRTREAFAYRFSRAAPSTTRTPLRLKV